MIEIVFSDTFLMPFQQIKMTFHSRKTPFCQHFYVVETLLALGCYVPELVASELISSLRIILCLQLNSRIKRDSD